MRKMTAIAVMAIGLLLLLTLANAQVVTHDLILLYDFTETSGTVIHERQGTGNDLTITEPTKVQWLTPGLRVTEATVVKSIGDRTALDQAIFFSKGITIEVWVKPLNNTQSGPARLVTFSQDSAQRNFTLGQSAGYWNQRFRTSVNPGNGTSPSTSTPAGSIPDPTVLQHVVYVRDAAGNAKMYIDKVEVAAQAIPGDGSNWEGSFDFGLFNEMSYPTNVRTWLGDLFKVAIYGAALTAAEVAQNFDAGVPGSAGFGSVTVAWDANTEPDLKGYDIHIGRVSRMSTKLEKIQQWCQAHEPSNEKCVEEWEAICTEPLDKQCHSMLYEYERIDRVADLPANRNPACPQPYDPFKTECCEYTISGLEKGETYYLAGTAYDEDNNESAYSEELTHKVKGGEPGKILNLRKIEEP